MEPDSEFFMVADLSYGYHQIALSDQASKYTTFVVSCGKGTRRYRWVRAPQGLNCSSDWFNFQSDKVFSHLEGVIKLVDDVLVQAPDWPTFLKRVEKVFEAARKNGVYISEKKIQYGKKVDYAGFIIAREGPDTVLRPDTKLLKSIREFPLPEKVSDIKTFQGILGQVQPFNPDTSSGLHKMRSLLKKGVDFLLTPEMITEFKAATKAFGSEYQKIYAFDAKLPIYLITDASYCGLGYALCQKHPEEKGYRIIHFGSKSLTPAMHNYSVSEIECAAIFLGVMKCAWWLRGVFFTIISDHKPLLGCFGNNIHDLTNARIANMREKLSGFKFKIEYLPGKLNYLADALSRRPLMDNFTEEEMSDWDEIEEESCRYTVFGREDDPSLLEVFDEAMKDKDYLEVIDKRLTGVEMKDIEKSSAARRYKDIYSEISLIQNKEGKYMMIYDGNKIVVPKGMRKKILSQLHKSHTSTDLFVYVNGSFSCEVCQRIFFM